MKPECVDVSVVIPAYRASGVLPRAIESVARQTQLVREVIVVDDASGDGAEDYVAAALAILPPGIERRLIVQPSNAGPSAARNVGLQSAKGRYVAFLDADDSWHPSKIEIQSRCFERDNELTLCGTQIIDLSTQGAFSRDIPAEPVLELIKPRDLLWRNRFGTATVMLRRVDAEVGFDTSMRYCEDYELWNRIARRGGKMGVVAAVLAYWHKPPFGDDGLSGSLAKMHSGELRALGSLRGASGVSGLAIAAARVFSHVKFLRRVALTALRRWRP